MRQALGPGLPPSFKSNSRTPIYGAETIAYCIPECFEVRNPIDDDLLRDRFGRDNTNSELVLFEDDDFVP